MKSILKSIGAVLAGFLTVVVLSVLTDMILESVGFFPPANQGIYANHLLLIALVYRMAYTVLGGYVTARLAPRNPMRHVWVLAIIGLAGGIAGVVGGWNLSAHWYPIAIAVTAVPCVWWGGKIGIKKLR